MEVNPISHKHFRQIVNRDITLCCSEFAFHFTITSSICSADTWNDFMFQQRVKKFCSTFAKLLEERKKKCAKNSRVTDLTRMSVACSPCCSIPREKALITICLQHDFSSSSVLRV